MRIRLAALALALAAATSRCAQETHIQDPARSKELNTQAYIQLLHTDLSAKKAQIVRETMELNDQQSAIFWPICRQYQDEQTKVTADKLAIVADYSQNFSTMTDEKAGELAPACNAARRKTHGSPRERLRHHENALSPTLAVRFFQVEHQLQLIVDLQIAANLPIIEENDAK